MAVGDPAGAILRSGITAVPSFSVSLVGREVGYS
jgi:hypothetical protein